DFFEFTSRCIICIYEKSNFLFRIIHVESFNFVSKHNAEMSKAHLGIPAARSAAGTCASAVRDTSIGWKRLLN
ncbi:MAG: hypothetical protein SV375_22985, partial [Thermodesulfobacteriota bacterium]|nr:hypothetical protein [Thermodesulfobacteriota bacterium]